MEGMWLVKIQTNPFWRDSFRQRRCLVPANHERMPVLLTREDECDTWLRRSPDEAFSLAREYPADQMRIVQEGFDREDLLNAQ